jgi:hypothetical protein
MARRNIASQVLQHIGRDGDSAAANKPPSLKVLRLSVRRLDQLGEQKWVKMLNQETLPC